MKTMKKATLENIRDEYKKANQRVSKRIIVCAGTVVLLMVL